MQNILLFSRGGGRHQTYIYLYKIKMGKKMVMRVNLWKHTNPDTLNLLLAKDIHVNTIIFRCTSIHYN
jgi:hypothetical protein